MRRLTLLFAAINFLLLSCAAQTTDAPTTPPTLANPPRATGQETMCNQPDENRFIATGQQVIFMGDESRSDRVAVTFSLFAAVYYLDKKDPCFSQLYKELNYSLQNHTDIEFSYQDMGQKIIYAKAIKSTATP